MLRFILNNYQQTAQKIKYAKFKAVDIVKSLRTGSKPATGPPVGDSTSQVHPDIKTLGPVAPSAPLEAHLESKPDVSVSIESTPNIQKAPTSAEESSKASPKVITSTSVPQEKEFNEVNAKIILQAGKHAKFAQSALLYDDIKTAVENLEKALALLKPLDH